MKHLTRLLLALLLLVAVEAQSATLTVNSTADSGAGTLRAAVSNAIAGDTIIFTNFLSGQTILLTSGEITLNKDLNIDASELTGGMVINGNNASRIFNVTAETPLLSPP